MTSVNRARARARVWCERHQEQFVRFECVSGSWWNFSHGCPTCVAAIRADVQHARAGDVYRDAPWQRTWDYTQRCGGTPLLRPPAGGR